MSDHQPQCMTNYFAHAECDCNAAELERLRAELAASREREARMRELFKRYEAEMRADNLISGMAAYEDLRDYMLAEGAQG